MNGEYIEKLLFLRRCLNQGIAHCIRAGVVREVSFGNASLRINSQQLEELGVNPLDFNEKEIIIKKDIAFVGLFWFDIEYKSLIDGAGFKIFTKDNIIQRDEIYPEGNHADYRPDIYKKVPRGRVSLRDGIIVINIGIDCPDIAIELVKTGFNLECYDNALIKVIKMLHWNIKRYYSLLSSL
jgi:hypothetical protein